MNKVTCICLGVNDMLASLHFYRDVLGFQTNETGDNPAVVFFSTPGTKFELFPLEALKNDIDPQESLCHCGGFQGITLAYNVERKEEVDEIISLIKTTNATVVKEPQDAFWGGYHAYFKDLDGYHWEVVWGEHFVFDEQGLLVM